MSKSYVFQCVVIKTVNLVIDGCDSEEEAMERAERGDYDDVDGEEDFVDVDEVVGLVEVIDD